MNPKLILQNLPFSLLACLILLMTAEAALALPSDKMQNMAFSSTEADVTPSVTILKGLVIIIQGTQEIHADKVTLHYDDKHKLQSLLAEGTPAHFQQQLEANKPIVHAEANNITYTLSKDHLTLDKNAVVEQANGGTMRGGRIDYDTTSGTAHASGAGNESGRVEFVIPPQTDKKE